MAKDNLLKRNAQDSDVDTDNELTQLRQENAELRAELEKLKSDKMAEPYKPSFTMSEGVRADIEMHGKAMDPMTGKMLTRDDLP